MALIAYAVKYVRSNDYQPLILDALDCYEHVGCRLMADIILRRLSPVNSASLATSLPMVDHHIHPWWYSESAIRLQTVLSFVINPGSVVHRASLRASGEVIQIGICIAH